jgi:CRISPR-associated protein Csd2
MSAKTVSNRYDIVYFFDITDGNPNGDPDAGNLPRIDPETGHGLVTDVCLKRKVRNFTAIARKEPGYGIFIAERAVLNNSIERAYRESAEIQEALRAWDAWKQDKKKNPRPTRAYEDIARDWLCQNFYDIRTFGAVLSTGEEKEVEGIKNKVAMTAGQVRGPIQISFSRSVDPVVSNEHAITRCAVTNERDLEKERTMGRKFTIPYALYRCHIFINPNLAAQTGFTEEDLQLFRTALNQMFEHDRSAARGMMAPRRCIGPALFTREGRPEPAGGSRPG